MAVFNRLRHAAQFTRILQNYQTFKYIKPQLYFNAQAPSCNVRLLSSQTAENPAQENYHNIVQDIEKSTGDGAKHEFQSETRMLLEIVAKSLYSDKEVFIRELISNASDALEKLRYLRLSKNLSTEEGGDRELEIHIATNKQNRTLIIQDTGIGMTKEELISNLGTIARSGSKAFLSELKDKQQSNDSAKIIGQFGVGFYSAFMVADKVEVFTKSYNKDAEGLYWSSDGTGSYEIYGAEGVQPGTKIIIHLKSDCREFSDESSLNTIIKKYSNFVGSPIFVNGKRINVIEPLWMMDPKQVTAQQHSDFYRFISNSFDAPRFILHYTTDVPLSIRALLYFPDDKPGLFEMSRDTSVGVALYSRKVLIKSKADNLLPKWLRFVKGVVDSEDIPLNLSRELLQNSALITKLRNVLTSKVLKFLYDKAKKEPKEYNEFYNDYGLFLKEGIVSSNEQSEKESIAKLLRFESSSKPPGEVISLPEYCQNLKENQKDIYYLAAPNRELAQQSPYYESFKKRDLEVLFCYEPYDELVLMQLGQYNMKFLTSVEKDMHQDTETEKTQSINKEEIDKLVGYIKSVLSKKAFEVKTTTRLENHPCVVTVQDMASARHFIRTQSQKLSDDMRYSLLRPRFEINYKTPESEKIDCNDIS
ncbi:Similar to Trap1: Heat shock protein 75 kDa [Cotesia congregata]|uniref:Heat shock protein 83 n=1 Tax=Cotesia congregata TaxID=51543 RepID=A0A8J2H450_COTCN|nr:Similar to Trap1: Heat shock protein 75 kDa [Cotesia congregata]